MSEEMIENNEARDNNENKDKKVKLKKAKKGWKLFLIILIALIILLVSIFVFWFLKPSTNMYIALLDKTVPATAADGHSYLDNVDNIYRKHIGLNWILNYEKIKNPETKADYDYKKDYYGYMVDENLNVQKDDEKVLSTFNEVPDLLYLSDTYGTEITEDKGITNDDMNSISLVHSMGGVVIGEQDIMITDTKTAISKQLQSLFGIEQTGWVGRYIYELSDLTDVPYWAPPMYESKYGVEWRCSGSGILLVSGDGDIIVLEEKTDFENDDLLKIYITEKYKEEFGNHEVNYYNWFELIKPTSGSQTIAEYEFNLNKTGMEKFEPVSKTPIFSAVVRNVSDKAPTYYFAGDFNDYVDDMKMNCFLGADLFYRLISFEHDGDITHFYWDFFEPMMKQILRETEQAGLVTHHDDEASNEDLVDKDLTRLQGDRLQVCIDDKWQDLSVKGFNLNAEAPGDDLGEYSRDVTYYTDLISAAAEMGANAIRAYDLYSPELYRALYEYNSKEDVSPIYLYQGVKIPDNIDAGKLTTDDAIKQMYQKIENTINALHGNAQLKSGFDNSDYKYYYNLGKYIAAYIVDTKLDSKDIETLNKNSKYTYSGKYLSSSSNSAEALNASLCDHLLSYQKDNYGSMVVVFAKGDTALLNGTLWQKNGYNLSKISVKDSAKSYFGVAYTAKYSDSTFTANQSKLTGASSTYAAYLAQIKNNSSVPVLIDDFGASTAMNTTTKNSNVSGLSEDQQSTQILEMYRAINSGSMVGGLVADLNDSWSKVSSSNYSVTVPYSSKGLWHDVTDVGQTTGVVAVDSKEPDETGLEFADGQKKVSSMHISRNETYLYITVNLKEDVNYTKEGLMVTVGFDTYPRGDGEYYYDSKFMGGGFAALEYAIDFENKDHATLYYVPSYLRRTTAITDKEWNSGNMKSSFIKKTTLNHGSFASQNTQFFVTGNIIRIRLPWSLLGVADPTKKIVIKDNATPSGADGQFKTTNATGCMCLSFVSNRSSKDTLYIFPSVNNKPTYRVYKWLDWEKSNIKYNIKTKTAADTLKSYFSTF